MLKRILFTKDTRFQKKQQQQQVEKILFDENELKLLILGNEKLPKKLLRTFISGIIISNSPFRERLPSTRELTEVTRVKKTQTGRYMLELQEDGVIEKIKTNCKKLQGYKAIWNIEMARQYYNFILNYEGDEKAKIKYQKRLIDNFSTLHTKLIVA